MWDFDFHFIPRCPSSFSFPLELLQVWIPRSRLWLALAVTSMSAAEPDVNSRPRPAAWFIIFF